MRNKAFLPLMEQLLMIAVFAIAAAVCLSAFAAGNRISKERSALDEAVLLAQNTCEILKHAEGDMEKAAGLTGGDWKENELLIYFDENGDKTDAESAVYLVRACRSKSEAGVGQAEVTVTAGETELYSVSVAWQEDSYEG